MTRSRRANVIALGNENPAWPDIDKAYANEAWQLLLRSLANEGYHCRAFTFFDDISFLEEFDPREWLVLNWGEEWAGEAWSDAEVAARIERYGFAYTGSPPDVLRFTQSRARVKERLRAAGLPTLPWRTCAHPADARRLRHPPSLLIPPAAAGWPTASPPRTRSPASTAPTTPGRHSRRGASQHRAGPPG